MLDLCEQHMKNGVTLLRVEDNWSTCVIQDGEQASIVDAISAPNYIKMEFIKLVKNNHR